MSIIAKGMNELSKDEVLIIGIGQGGCMLAERLYSKGYTCLFINSATGDLGSLYEVEKKHIIHYKDGSGAGQDRRIGRAYAQQDIQRIYDKIDKQYNSAKYVFVAFSGAGGTGSGGGTYTIEALHQRYNPEREGKEEEIPSLQDRYIGAIMILPSKKDGITLEGYKNAIECYTELENLVKAKKVNAVMLADNDMMDSWEINEAFAEDFDSLITLPDRAKATGRSIDGNDLIRSLKGHGYLHVSSYTLPAENDKDINHISASPYMPMFTKASGHALLATVNIEEEASGAPMENIKKYYTPPQTVCKMGTVMGTAIVDDEEVEIEANKAFAFGLPMPQSVKTKLEKFYNEDVDLIEQNSDTEEEVEVNLKEINVEPVKQSKGEIKSLLADEVTPAQPKKKLSQREMILMRMKNKK